MTPLYGATGIDFNDASAGYDGTSVPRYGLPVGFDPGDAADLGEDAGYGAPGIDFDDAGDVAVIGLDAAYGSPGIGFGDAGTDAGNTALDSSTDSSHD